MAAPIWRLKVQEISKNRYFAIFSWWSH